MGSNGGDEVVVSGSETTVEIKIKTLDSQTYTLRVDKCVPVPALKEQIATVTGVLSEQQRLICRGKVLKDDQLLSAYHVEDGHTLHMVVRQPGQPSMVGSVDHSASNSGDQIHQSGPSVVVRTFDISEPSDGLPPDINRFVSALLGSFGVPNIGSGSEGADLSEAASERIFRTVRVVSRNPGGTQTDQTTANGSSNLGTGVGSFSASAPLELPVIPDSLTTLTQYLTRMRNEFDANGNSPQPGDDVANNRHDSGGFPTPASLAEVIMSTRELLMNQSANSLFQLAGQLENQANVTDPLARMNTQSNALRTGHLLQHLGALLLELGRTTMTLRMGQTPAESVVNAGPAVFISTSGPNPIMVQPLQFQPGASVGTVPGIGQHGGSMDSGFHSRNIDIRIRTGPSMPSLPPTTSQGEATDAQQPQGQTSESAVPSSTRESEIRMIPIRTVVAALPASGTSHLPVGSFIPVVARVQRVSNANLGTQRGSQSSSSNQTVPHEGSGLPGENANVPAGNRAQNSQDFSTGISSSFDQLLRSIFPSENIHISDMNVQGLGTGSPTSETGTTQGVTAVNTASNQESSPAGGDGVFLSNLLRQIMPIISENAARGSAAGAGDTGNSDTQTSPTQGQEDTNRQTRSGRRGNPPSSPSPKRQRR